MPARLTRRIGAATLLATSVAGCASMSSAVPPAPAPAGTAAAATTLIIRLGTDTLAVEQYTRSASRIDGVLATRMPFAVLSRYSVQLGADNAPTSAEYAFQRGDGTAVPRNVQPVSFRFRSDSVTITGHRPAGDTTRTIAARGMMLPYLPNSFGLFELALVRQLASGRDSATFGMLPLSFIARGTTALPVRLYAADSVRMQWFGDPLYMRHDGRGGIIAVDGSHTTDKVLVERVAATDVAELARRWSAREGAAGAAGFPSTRDTLRATIGGAHVWVDYGRPALRGRNVWVNGVLGDTLWRTGANAATQLGTDAELLVGGVRLPAGTYSLFTWAGRSDHHLIVNRQSGQWGTDYDASRDVARIPLRDTDGAPSMERFTIMIEPQGADAASLVLAWGTRRLSVPVSTK